MTTEFFPAVVLLLLVADPFGNIPIFIAALREVPAERRLRIVLRECLIAFGVLSVFVFLAGRSSRPSGCPNSHCSWAARWS